MLSTPPDPDGPLARFEAIGSDRYLRLAEICGADDSFAARAWEVYEAEFGRFTGALADSAFRRLDHPASHVGRVVLPADTVALVVGTGPSLAARHDQLRRIREHCFVITSLRGAMALEDLGLAPDLVLIADASPLEATVTLQLARAHGFPACLTDGPGPLVAADGRTPRALIKNVPLDRLFIPVYCPTWRWWPAAATAMALEGGSRRVALLGVDAGPCDGVDGPFEPLVALLELLAASGTAGDAEFSDCGGGRRKAGWRPGALEHLPQLPALASLERVARQPVCERLAEDRRTLQRVTARVAQARARFERGIAFERDGADALAEDMLAWAAEPWLRRALQEELGLSFLPGFWRMACGHGRRDQLVDLALTELFSQCDRLGAAIDAGLREAGREDP